MRLAIVTPPAAEPVLIAEAKLQVRIDHDEENDLLTTLIQAAREYCEKDTQRAFITQTWDYKLDCFPSGAGGYSEAQASGSDAEIELPMPPLISVTSIQYVDTSGSTQTVDPATYVVDTSGVYGRVYPAYGEAWPSTRSQPNAVTIRQVCGYGAAGTSVPASLKSAMKLLLANMHKYREPEVSGGIVNQLKYALDALLSGYRVRKFCDSYRAPGAEVYA